MARHPVFASFLGFPGHDDELADGSREAMLEDAALAHQFIAELEAIDPAELSPYYAIERELGLFATRREVFDIEEHRVWERRVSASDEIGDGVFLLMTRGTRPLGDRLMSIASRIEQSPTHDRAAEDAPERRFAAGQAVERDGARSDRVDGLTVRRGHRRGQDGVRRRRRGGRCASTKPRATHLLPSPSTRPGCSAQMGRATEDYPLGREKYDELVGLRAFDGLTSDDILQIGEQQLVENRAATGCPGASRSTRRSRSSRSSTASSRTTQRTSTQALHLYRDAMDEARQYVIDHDIATMPAGERLSVIATPEYLRSVMPFAAYFSAPKFGADGEGRRGHLHRYAVGRRRPAAMREHNFASIYNTSHPRGLSRPSPAAVRRQSTTRASFACSSTRLSSSRAGPCTASR